IERMLHEKPEARGSASELAQAFEKAAEREGKTADVQENPSRSLPLPEKALRPGTQPGYWLRSRAPWLAAGAAIGASTAVLLVLPASHHDLEEFEDEPLPLAEGREQQDAGVAAEEATGVADAGVEESLASVVNFSAARGAPGRISRAIPK